MGKIKTKFIEDEAITLAKMADMATASLIYRKTAGAGVPQVNTLATLKTDLDLAVKATGSELDTGTDDAKFSTAAAIKDSHNVPSVAPGTSGNVLTSDGTDWTSATASGGNKNVDGGAASSVYLASQNIDGGTA